MEKSVKSNSTHKGDNKNKKGKRTYVYREKKQKADNQQRKKVEPRQTAGLKSVTENRQQSNGTGSMIIPTEMVTDELTYAAATYMSYVYYRGIIAANKALDPDTVVSGMSYLIDGILKISTGQTQELTNIPRIFDILTQLLTPKVLRLYKGTINYTPQWDSPGYALPESFETGVKSVFCFSPPASNSVLVPYVSTPVPVIPDAYSQFLNCHDSTFRDQFTALVEYGATKGMYTNDASCYARNYTYFGTAGAVGGFYSDVEIEVPTYYPLFSKFTRYDRDDKVVSRVFHPQSGGICTPIGLSLTSGITKQMLKNPIPVNYKFLDFNQLYCTLGTWLCTLWSQVPAGIQGSPNNLLLTPIPFNFSVNDFCWLLRQCVLAMFPEQVHGQFVAPVEALPSSTNSVFVPFIVDGVIHPVSHFQSMMLPTFIVENLNMLRQKLVRVEKTRKSEKFASPPQKLCHTWCPVWGVYSGDQLPYFQFKSADGSDVPLFATDDVIPSCRIWDGVSTSAGNSKVNVNPIVADLLAEWNSWITGFGKNHSVPMSTLSADMKMDVTLLPYTRIIEEFDAGQKKEKKPYFARFTNKFDDFVINSPTNVAKLADCGTKDKKKGKVNIIPPASMYELYTSSISSIEPIGLDINGAIRYFMLPSIRLNVTSGDYLTKNAYQTVTGELCQTTTMLGDGVPAAPNEVTRLQTIGNLLCAGEFAASATNDTLTQAVKTMSDHGGGIDFLNSLLGGLASVIPVVGPMLGSLLAG